MEEGVHKTFQEMLDENQQLILAIMENQSLGKMQECSDYHEKLNHNLIFLSGIAKHHALKKYKLRIDQLNTHNQQLQVQQQPSISMEQLLQIVAQSNGQKYVEQATKEAAARRRTVHPHGVGIWSPVEHAAFVAALEKYGQKDVKNIVLAVGTRTPKQVRAHLEKYLRRMRPVCVDSDAPPTD